MLEIKSESVQDVLIVTPAGRLDGLSSKDFSERMITLLAGATHHVVLNLSELAYISSEGLRVILMAAKQAKSGGGALTLCAAQPSVYEVLDISGFAPMLGLHDNIDEAVRILRS